MLFLGHVGIAPAEPASFIFVTALTPPASSFLSGSRPSGSLEQRQIKRIEAKPRLRLVVLCLGEKQGQGELAAEGRRVRANQRGEKCGVADRAMVSRAS